MYIIYYKMEHLGSHLCLSSHVFIGFDSLIMLDLFRELVAVPVNE